MVVMEPMEWSTKQCRGVSVWPSHCAPHCLVQPRHLRAEAQPNSLIKVDGVNTGFACASTARTGDKQPKASRMRLGCTILPGTEEEKPEKSLHCDKTTYDKKRLKETPKVKADHTNSCSSGVDQMRKRYTERRACMIKQEVRCEVVS